KALLDAIIQHKGDPAKVIAAAERMTGPQRFWRAFRETNAGLFSAGTLTTNVVGGGMKLTADMVARLVADGYGLAHQQITGRGNREFIAKRYADMASAKTIGSATVTGLVRVAQHLSNEIGAEASRVLASGGTEGVGTKLAAKVTDATGKVSDKLGKVTGK